MRLLSARGALMAAVVIVAAVALALPGLARPLDEQDSRHGNADVATLNHQERFVLVHDTARLGEHSPSLTSIATGSAS